MKETGKIIKSLRLKNGMTQEEVGRHVGLGKAAIQKYENGSIKNIKRAVIIALAELFRVTPSYLMGLDEPASGMIIKNKILEAIPILSRISPADSFDYEKFAIGYDYIKKDDMLEYRKYVCLEVKDDRMYPVFISGDLVVVQCQESAGDGHYVVVCIDDNDGEIRKFNKGEDYISLESINPMYPPSKFTGDEMRRVKIVGLVKGLKRTFSQA